ncbi:MAG: thioredoxin domain-containing protein [Deltaproteobacteria bacterium]|nr:thioredoxin domain-containing protein [Deltaproteobacteria bacterium]
MQLALLSLVTAVSLTVASLGCGGTPPPAGPPTPAPAVNVAPDPPGPAVAELVEPARIDPWEGEAILRDNGGGPLPITTRDPTKGPDGALVTVVVFSDYQCSACAFYAKYLDEVRAAAPSPIRLVHKNYPLHSHPKARAAAEAATAVLVIGGPAAFWPYYHRLFAQQHLLDDGRYLAWAAELGISAEQFRAVQARPVVPAKVAADRALGEQLGVNGTPYVFANCRALGDLEAIGQLIAEEHRSAEQAVATGVAPRDIYEHRCRANVKPASP